MYKTHTVFFKDYNGQPDYEMYSSTCVPDAERQFNRDHPDRELIFIGLMTKGNALRAFGNIIIQRECGMLCYQSVMREEQTGYVETFTFWAENNEDAIKMASSELKQRQQIRSHEGGFGLEYEGLWLLYPYHIVSY